MNNVLIFVIKQTNHYYVMLMVNVMYLEFFVVKSSVINSLHYNIFLNSKLSYECIEFTMICVFFVSVWNNALISNFRGGFRWQTESLVHHRGQKEKFLMCNLSILQPKRDLKNIKIQFFIDILCSLLNELNNYA